MRTQFQFFTTLMQTEFPKGARSGMLAQMVLLETAVLGVSSRVQRVQEVQEVQGSTATSEVLSAARCQTRRRLHRGSRLVAAVLA